MVAATQREAAQQTTESVVFVPGEGYGDSGPPARREAHPVLAASLALTVLLLAVYALASADRQTDTPDAWFDISVYDFTSQEHPTAFEAQPWFWSIGFVVFGWHLLGVCYLLDNTAYADQPFMCASRPAASDESNVTILAWPAWYWPSSLTALALWILGFVLLVCHRDTLIPAVVLFNLGSLFAWHHLLHVYRDGTVAPSATTYGLYIVSFATLAVWMETASGFLLGAAWARHSASALDADSSTTFVVWTAFKISFFTAGVAALYASVELAICYAAVFVITLASYLESMPAIGSHAAPSAADAVGVLLVAGVGLNAIVGVWSLWRRVYDFPGGYLESFNNSKSHVVAHLLTWTKAVWRASQPAEYPAGPSGRVTVRQAVGTSIRGTAASRAFTSDYLSAPQGLRQSRVTEPDEALIPAFAPSISTDKGAKKTS